MPAGTEYSTPFILTLIISIIVFRPFQLFLNDSTELTLFDTSTALYALRLVDNVSFLNLTGDCACGTNSGAESTALTLVSDDFVGKELLTYACRALLVHDVSDVFVTEVTELNSGAML